LAATIHIISENCGLILAGFGDDGSRFMQSPTTKEKSQMPGAAFAAAERPHKQENQEGPFQHAVTVGTQNILAPA
jgi:hypothetical protein